MLKIKPHRLSPFFFYKPPFLTLYIKRVTHT